MTHRLNLGQGLYLHLILDNLSSAVVQLIDLHWWGGAADGYRLKQVLGAGKMHVVTLWVHCYSNEIQLQ